MAEPQASVPWVTGGAPTALLIGGDELSAGEQNLAKMLNFFSIPWKALKVCEIANLPASTESGTVRKYCILSSASRFAEVIRPLRGSACSLPPLLKKVESVYLYGFQNSGPCRDLLWQLTSGLVVQARPLHKSQVTMSIAGDCPEMCGPMSEMRIPVTVGKDEIGLGISVQGDKCQRIIRAEDDDVFFRVVYKDVPFYLNVCCNIIDIQAPITEYFDVRKSFCEAVPSVMYLRWAFSETCCGTGETDGCLIIDDPPLKPQYGYLEFSKSLHLMGEHNFTTTIGFIPWNWWRTHPLTVAIFKQHPDRFSLATHGCDHTEGEFAVHSLAVLSERSRIARQRMDLFSQKTSLPYAPVMIFPQGAFSPEAGRALKLNGFAAAVNTEVAPSDRRANQTTVSDTWDVAIMKYGTFPIFTRRYLFHGIENFAFDALLGKPCLIAAHHDVYRDDGRELLNFVSRLNSLNWNFRWRSLDDVIRHSCKMSVGTDGTSMVRMFAERLVLENPSAEQREAVVLKDEDDPDCVMAVMVNREAVKFGHQNGFLFFRVTLLPETSGEVRIVHSDMPDLGFSEERLGRHVKTAARRYLSEFRDNYLSRSDFLYGSATRMTRLLKRAVNGKQNLGKRQDVEQKSS